MSDMIDAVIEALLNGMKRADNEVAIRGEAYIVKGYWVGEELIRLDITKQ